MAISGLYNIYYYIYILYIIYTKILYIYIILIYIYIYILGVVLGHVFVIFICLAWPPDTTKRHRTKPQVNSLQNCTISEIGSKHKKRYDRTPKNTLAIQTTWFQHQDSLHNSLADTFVMDPSPIILSWKFESGCMYPIFRHTHLFENFKPTCVVICTAMY